MKVVFILLVCSLVQVQAAVSARQLKVSIELKNVTLEKVFQDVYKRQVYNASNQVVGLELIPQHELKRPRVDVVFAPSGLYRDIFPELMALLLSLIHI